MPERERKTIEADELVRLARQRMLARCDRTGRFFSVGSVEVIQRYADCSLFRCPACGGQHDDRPRWGGADGQRQGYTDVTVEEAEAAAYGHIRWLRPS